MYACIEGKKHTENYALFMPQFFNSSQSVKTSACSY